MKVCFQRLWAAAGLLWFPFALILAAGLVPELWILVAQESWRAEHGTRLVTRFEAICYDLPFWGRRPLSPILDIVIVEITTNCLDRVDQHPPDGKVDRPWMAAFLEQMADSKAKLLVLDCLLIETNADVEADRRIADSLGRLHREGRVLIATSSRFKDRQRPAALFATNATVALADVDDNPGRTVRLIPGVFDRTGTNVSLAWMAAERLGTKVTRREAAGALRWMNYFGPSTHDAVSSSRAVFPWVAFGKVVASPSVLSSGGPKIDEHTVVFVGGGTEDGDRFQNPVNAELMMGVEVQATALVNLRDGTWLRQVPEGIQTLMLAAWALALAMVLDRWRTPAARFGAIGGTTLLGVGSIVLHRVGGWWWLWLIPVLVQMPVGLLWSLLPDRQGFFISYRDSDGRSEAQWLEGAILGHGRRAYLAPGRIEVGTIIWRRLEREIRSARVLLLVLTPDARRDLLRPLPIQGEGISASADDIPWVRREVALALQLRRRILVLCVGSVPLKREELASDVAALAGVQQMEFRIERREAAIDAAFRLLRAGRMENS